MLYHTIYINNNNIINILWIINVNIHERILVDVIAVNVLLDFQPDIIIEIKYNYSVAAIVIAATE